MTQIESWTFLNSFVGFKSLLYKIFVSCGCHEVIVRHEHALSKCETLVFDS